MNADRATVVEAAAAASGRASTSAAGSVEDDGSATRGGGADAGRESPAGVRPVRLEVGRLDDTNLAAVLTLVAQHPPFAGYSFGLVVNNLANQLRHGANVLARVDGRLLAYAGWLRVERTAAAAWQAGRAAIPVERWADGDAAIVTVVVADERALVPALLRGISHVCAGVPVYRMRSFGDGRADMRRPPIVGRRHVFA